MPRKELNGVFGSVMRNPNGFPPTTTLLSALLWLAAGAAAALLSAVRVSADAVPAALGIAAVVAAPWSRRTWQVLTITAVVTAATFASGTLLPWALCAAIATVWLAQERSRADGLSPELKLLIARRGRRPASVLVAILPGASVQRLRAALRLTDGFDYRPARAGIELHGVIDDCSVHDRSTIERRLSELSAAVPAFGWALYPDEGLTLDVLVAAARQRAMDQAAAETSGATPALQADWRPVA